MLPSAPGLRCRASGRPIRRAGCGGSVRSCRWSAGARAVSSVAGWPGRARSGPSPGCGGRSWHLGAHVEVNEGGSGPPGPGRLLRKPVWIRGGPAAVTDGSAAAGRHCPAASGRGPGQASAWAPGDSRGHLPDGPPGRISRGEGRACPRRRMEPVVRLDAFKVRGKARLIDAQGSTSRTVGRPSRVDATGGVGWGPAVSGRSAVGRARRCGAHGHGRVRQVQPPVRGPGRPRRSRWSASCLQVRDPLRGPAARPGARS